MSIGPNFFRTTTFRLSLIFLILFGAAAAVAIGYIYWNTTVLLSRQLDETIEAEIQGLAEQYRSGGLTRLVNTVAGRSLTPGSSLYLVTDRAGGRIAGNLSSVSRDLWNTVGRVQFVYTRPTEGGSENRVALATIFRLPAGYRLIVGRDIEDRRRFELVIRQAFFLSLGVMALVGLGGGWIMSRNILARIDTVTDTSRTIMSGDLSGRVPVTGSGDELDRLSENLNAMLDKIEQLMTGLREVSDNIAHDLKTPLNRLRNRAEVALSDASGETDYREALERTIDEADDLIKTFNALLSIARLEAGAGSQNMEDVEVAALVHDMTELYEPLAEEHGLRLETDVPETVRLRADRQLLGQALANMVDNAIKYAADGSDANGAGPARSLVSVTGRLRGGRLELAVADHGPGIPEQERERVLKRFVRLEASRSRPGSGLGLSLVAAVAQLHGGEVRLEDNGPGLRVVLSLPLTRDPGGTRNAA